MTTSSRAQTLAFSLGLVWVMQCACAPTSAEEMDLSSTAATSSAPSLPSGMQILVDGQPKTIRSNDVLTPAEMLAFTQLVSTGAQRIVISSSGAAIGGSINLLGDVGANISSLTIPRGVKAIAGFSGPEPFSITGLLSNHGSIFALSTNPQVRQAAINAGSIINNQGGLITSVLPSALAAQFGALPGRFDLLLNAKNSVVNHGTIEASGTLSLQGVDIVNTGVLRSQSNIVANAIAIKNSGEIIGNGIYFNTNEFTNLGLVDSLTERLCFNALPDSSSLRVGNGGGTLRSAEEIIFTALGRDVLPQVEVKGGEIDSQQLKLNADFGQVHLASERVSGVVNASAATVIITAASGDLHIGTVTASGDPILALTGGGTLFLTAPFKSSNGNPADFIVLSEGSIHADPNFTGSAQTFTWGGKIVLSAGYEFSGVASGCTDCGGLYSISKTPTGFTGDILLDGWQFYSMGDQPSPNLVQAGSITVQASHDINIGLLMSTSGVTSTGALNPEHGKRAGDISVSGRDVTIRSIEAQGGQGQPYLLTTAVGTGLPGTNGGNGGNITINARNLESSGVHAPGGRGMRGQSAVGTAIGGVGGRGGDGGDVVINAESAVIGAVSSGGLLGGPGGSSLTTAGNGGQGGDSGSVIVKISGIAKIDGLAVTGGPGGEGAWVDMVNAPGGRGGNGGNGGNAGTLIVEAGTLFVKDNISAFGGFGGDGASFLQFAGDGLTGLYRGGNGGDGGEGGVVLITACCPSNLEIYSMGGGGGHAGYTLDGSTTFIETVDGAEGVSGTVTINNTCPPLLDIGQLLDLFGSGIQMPGTISQFFATTILPTDATPFSLPGGSNLGAIELVTGSKQTVTIHSLAGLTFGPGANLATFPGLTMHSLGTNSIRLEQGAAVFSPTEDLSIDTSQGTIKILGGSAALVVAMDDGVAVFDLSDGRRGNISFSHNGRVFKLTPGQLIALTRGDAEEFKDLGGVIGNIPVRLVTKETLDDATAFHADFALMSAIQLSGVDKDKSAAGSKLLSVLMKQAAALHLATNDRGPYKLP